MSSEPGLYAGLISGTSVDGIEAVLLDVRDERLTVVAHHPHAYDDGLRRDLIACGQGASLDADRLSILDAQVGDCFADALLALIDAAGVPAERVVAAGSHGQTIWHAADDGRTLQIGDPNRIAARSGVTTVADFRRADMAHGGQGAPLVPPFHAALFAKPDEPRAILNLGGIANLTLLDDQPIRGFDTGPANALMDDWAQEHLGSPCDSGGQLAAAGTVDPDLLNAWLAEPYFAAGIPKSTGREVFNLTWARRLAPAIDTARPADVQATLAELTARTVADAIARQAPSCRRVIACGGGTANPVLMRRLTVAVGIPVESSADHGIEPDQVEAAAFAWLAHRRLAGLPGNAPSVTGARRAVPLGGVYLSH